MFKYLLVQCEELHDQFECDCNRTPVRLVEDYKTVDTDGMEVYEILENGEIGNCVKDYEEYELCGYALIDMKDSEDKDNWIILDKIYVGSRIEAWKDKKMKKWIKEYFNGAEIDDIRNTFLACGEYFDPDIDENIAITLFQGNTLYYPY